VLAAVSHTAHRYNIAPELFSDFLTSMRMDLTVTDYPNRDALNVYMRGSAEAIGLQLLPILGTVGSMDEAAPYAAGLGRAFQLTNCLRDVDEDLMRHRIYLPADELAAYGVDRDVLMWCHAHRRTDDRVRRALAAQHDITREVYRYATKGIALLAPRSRPCVAAAATLYSEILDCIEDSGFAVFGHRAAVSTTRRLQVAGAGLIRSWRVRRSGPDRRRRGAAWLSPRPWRCSAQAFTGSPGARPRRCCPSLWSFCSGMRWRSPLTCGPTTPAISPACGSRFECRSKRCCSSS
jgi:phytoene synthase